MPSIELYIVLLFVCLVLSAFFSGSETAFISLQRFRLEHLISSEIKGASRVAKMIGRPERFLSVVLLGNTLVNAADAALARAEVIAEEPVTVAKGVHVRSGSEPLRLRPVPAIGVVGHAVGARVAHRRAVSSLVAWHPAVMFGHVSVKADGNLPEMGAAKGGPRLFLGPLDRRQNLGERQNYFEGIFPVQGFQRGRGAQIAVLVSGCWFLVTGIRALVSGFWSLAVLAPSA